MTRARRVFLVMTWLCLLADSRGAADAPAASDWLVSRLGLVYACELGISSIHRRLVTAFDDQGAQTEQGKSVSFVANRGGGLAPRGLARYDHHFALLTEGGSFVAVGGVNHILDSCKTSGAITVEMLVTPAKTTLPDNRVILWLGPSSGAPNFALCQDGETVSLRLRTAVAGNAAESTTGLFRWPDGKAHHLAVTYGDSNLTACLDGQPVLRSQNVKGDLSRWRASELVCGDNVQSSANWPGKLEGLAIFNRALDLAEIQQQNAACRRQLASRKEPARLTVQAKLRARSAVPDAQKIEPYYQALTVYEYEVEKVTEGDYAARQIRVAHWGMLDKKVLPIAERAVGQSYTLQVESMEANPQLESQWLSETLAPSDLPLFYDVTPPG